MVATSAHTLTIVRHACGAYEEYHPYGSTAWWAGDSATVSQKRYRYTGMERDEETGLQCHGVRYYATWLGRWVSADPIGLGDGVNRFAYTSGNPAGRYDASGFAGQPAPVSSTTASAVPHASPQLRSLGTAYAHEKLSHHLAKIIHQNNRLTTDAAVHRTTGAIERRMLGESVLNGP